MLLAPWFCSLVNLVVNNPSYIVLLKNTLRLFMQRAKADYIYINFIYKSLYYGKEEVVKSDRELFAVLKTGIESLTEQAQHLDAPSVILLEETLKCFENRYMMRI